MLEKQVKRMMETGDAYDAFNSFPVPDWFRSRPLTLLKALEKVKDDDFWRRILEIEKKY